MESVESNGGGERAAIERIRTMLPGPGAGETWIGDDAAVVAPPHEWLLLTADAVVAGVHADLSLVRLDDLGWKSVAVAVSDVAAMGCTPRHTLVTVCGPADTDLDLLYGGISQAAEAYGCPVVGGDLSGGRELAVSVTVTGDSGPRPPVLRSGAGPGDALLVTGPLGASAAGLRRLRAGSDRDDPLAVAYRRPQARVAEGEAARAGGATAMIDVSDGLAVDLGHLARASGVGAVLDDVPVAEGATRDEALGGGEDYELVFAAADPEQVAAAFDRAGLAPPVPLGRCTAEAGQLLLGGEPMPSTGWEHEWRR